MPITPKPLQIEVYCRDCGTYLQCTWNRSEISVEPCQCPLNEMREVYEQYGPSPKWTLELAVDLWQAIKASVERPETLPDALPTEASTDTGCSVP